MIMYLLLLTSLLGLSWCDNSITGYTGENVTLTCSSINTPSSVALRRHGREHFISYCRDGHATDPKHQDPSFVGRVEGIKCPMEDGNVSVTLKNLTRDDAGEYEWVVINNGTKFTYTVLLNVTDRNTTSGNSPGAGVIAGGAAAAAVAVAGIIIIVYLCRRRSRRRTIPCRDTDEQKSDPVTYSEVDQQQTSAV